MEDVKTVEVIFLDKAKELPVTVNDNFQPKNADGSPVVVEFAPVGVISEQMAEKLIKTYPKLYAKYNPAVHTDSKEGYNIAKNYRKPQFENIFNQLTPDQRDIVLQYMHEVKNGGVVPKPETQKLTPFEELRAQIQNQVTQD